MITVRQVKAARALLDWPQRVLSERSGVGWSTIGRLEAHDGVLDDRSAHLAIIKALEGGGIRFLSNGVKLRG